MDVESQEHLSADEVLITTPFYNFGIPSALKAWIDHIVRLNRTFTANYEGLAKGRKVVGSGRATAQAAGPVQVKVELRRGVRARSLRGKALTLRVVWSGASGGSSTATATVRAR